MSENPDIFHRIVGGGEGGKIGEGNCAQNPALRGFVGYVLHSPSPLTETKFVRNSKLCVCVCVSLAFVVNKSNCVRHFESNDAITA
jgi:hypothetical protein